LLVGVAASVGLWLLFWHGQDGWAPWASLAIAAFLSLFVLVTFTAAVVRTVRQDRARAVKGCSAR